MDLIQDRTPTPSSPPPPTAIDLFCGAGGFSLGLHNAGFQIVQAFDHAATALETYHHNLGSHAHHCALEPTTELSPTTIIVGGPPCQGFSSAGRRTPGDQRNTLVSVFATLVAKHQPLAFIFENVEGFLTAERGARVFDLLTPLINVGYRIHLRKINAANYGVPQHRKRVIAIGGLGWDPPFPDPTHTAYGAPGAHQVASGLPPTPTVSETFQDLPPATIDPPGVPPDHVYRQPQGDDQARLELLKPGQTMRDLPISLQHPTYHRRAHRRVKDGTPTERRGGAPAGIRRLSPHLPSKAITSNAHTEFVHPYENRYLTLRECARLQTFPDTFLFQGTHSERALLIGNALPPRLAQILAQTLRDSLKNAQPLQAPGALLSFIPTLSTGMSPELARVTAMVQAKFEHPSLTYEQLTLWP